VAASELLSNKMPKLANLDQIKRAMRLSINTVAVAEEVSEETVEMTMMLAHNRTLEAEAVVTSTIEGVMSKHQASARELQPKTTLALLHSITMLRPSSSSHRRFI